MTWAGGVEDAVEKRNPEQAGDGGGIGFDRAGAAREHPVEFRLLGEYPTHDSVGGRRWRGARASAEGIALRENGIEHALQQKNAGGGDDDGGYLKRGVPAEHRHGHFTAILVAKFAPMFMLAK